MLIFRNVVVDVFPVGFNIAISRDQTTICLGNEMGAEGEILKGNARPNPNHLTKDQFLSWKRLKVFSSFLVTKVLFPCSSMVNIMNCSVLCNELRRYQQKSRFFRYLWINLGLWCFTYKGFHIHMVLEITVDHFLHQESEEGKKLSEFNHEGLHQT